ncbi:thiol:disulfide interchange protein DsbA/DsbL [Parashewanella spongiae]|uniref:Thiol:disulfide interchange protein n=1 Tax=Parashewanella spongiae TaxID=342950 RepID=A0A3A6TV52_9GAMM|nr:thiol:disulfide interchange protein DsbA/DsbL [Parashewanella spongiae]MCL1077755.1 thiol:disulfide interchange protein DsbA/DsbL [Parashewanella spongiae]RJY18154.1 thiol:disulfide interchange protein DsbA/DsbL [Parashewanella spongiae]
MKRSLTAPLIIIILSLLPAMSHATEFKQGVHYQAIDNPSVTSTPTFTEYFSFFCAQCYRFSKTFAPVVRKKLPTNIKFRQVHVDGSQVTNELSKAYVLAERLHKDIEVETVLFDAIHQHKDRPKNIEDVLKLVTQSSLNDKSYAQVNSFTVNSAVAANRAEVKHFNITVIPTLIVNGKYQINYSSLKSEQQLIELVTYLVAK